MFKEGIVHPYLAPQKDGSGEGRRNGPYVIPENKQRKINKRGIMRGGHADKISKKLSNTKKMLREMPEPEL